MLAVHLCDLADALGEAPLAGGELAAQLGDVGVRSLRPELRDASRSCSRSDSTSGSSSAARVQRGVALGRQRPSASSSPETWAARPSSWPEDCSRSAASSASSASASRAFSPPTAVCSRSCARSFSSACARASAASRCCGELLELGAGVLVAAGAKLLELGLERAALSSAASRPAAIVRRVWSSLSSSWRFSAVSARRPSSSAIRSAACCCARSSSSRLAAAACSWLSSAPTRSCDLGVDAGLVRLGGLAQPRLQLVEALGQRVPLGQDGVQLRLELLDPGVGWRAAARAPARLPGGLGRGLGAARAPARARTTARAAATGARAARRGSAGGASAAGPASRSPEPSGAAAGVCGAERPPAIGSDGCGASVRIGARPAISRRPALVPYSVRSRPPCCSASAFATAPGRDEAEVDEHLPERRAAAILLGEGVQKLVFGQEALVDHDLAELSPGVGCRIHEVLIGRKRGSPEGV